MRQETVAEMPIGKRTREHHVHPPLPELSIRVLVDEADDDRSVVVFVETDGGAQSVSFLLDAHLTREQCEQMIGREVLHMANELSVAK